jgi:hypothetical protein
VTGPSQYKTVQFSPAENLHQLDGSTGVYLEGCQRVCIGIRYSDSCEMEYILRVAVFHSVMYADGALNVESDLLCRGRECFDSLLRLARDHARPDKCAELY